MTAARRRRELAGACAAHLLHDGYADLLYALLPVWQAELGLSYAGLAMVRVLYYGTMGTLQLPMARWLGKVDARVALGLATFIAALGYAVVSLSSGFVVLGAGLMLSGLGSSAQHPRAASLVTSAYGKNARGPLGIYNFSGDLGKAIFPAVVAMLLPVLAWRSVLGIVATFGVMFAALLFFLIPHERAPEAAEEMRAATKNTRGNGFRLLLTIGALDTAPRMGYLLFLPFLVRAKGGAGATIGIALALLFVGGGFGKAVCGWLGQRLGVVSTVIVTEAATALFMLATLALPLGATLCVLPLLGVVLNGTSSVLYGTVPELAPRGDTSRAFALFYTGNLVMGAISPIVFGTIADHTARAVGIGAAAFTAALIIPLVLALRPALSAR